MPAQAGIHHQKLTQKTASGVWAWKLPIQPSLVLCGASGRWIPVALPRLRGHRRSMGRYPCAAPGPHRSST